MITLYDVVTLILFAGVAILFLQRSFDEEISPNDSIYRYFPPALGCAVADWLGDHLHDVGAILVIVAVVFYVLRVLKPFQRIL